MLSQYTIAVGARLTSLGNAGGFSGARLWRIEGPTGRFCVRRWPREAPTPMRLAWIHRILRQVEAAGCPLLATPRVTVSGSTYLSVDGYLWELAPWLPGMADFQRHPSARRVAAALAALAEVHEKLASATSGTNRGGAAGIASRLRTAEQLLGSGAEAIAAAVRSDDPSPEMAILAAEVTTAFKRYGDPLRRQLAAAQSVVVPNQVCLRDVWHAHVLFDEDRVTGIVDYGAIDVDSVASDVGRLLGSMAGDDTGLWQAGLDAYRAVRPLSAAEESLIEIYDSSGTLLGAMNWLRWIYVERRQFADPAAIASRIRGMLERMNGWC